MTQDSKQLLKKNYKHTWRTIFETYYESLYTQPDRAEALNVEQVLNQLDLPSIGKLQNYDPTKVVTIEEVDKGISGLKVGKSPGTDGFPSEWYKSMREQ